MSSSPRPVAWHAVPLAHRGRHTSTVPENSLAAFDAAATRGHGVELDVRVTCDGVAVVCHDDDLRAVTGRQGRVSRLTAAAVTRRSLVVRGQPAADGPHTLPTLVEALDLLAGRVPVMVEVKNEGPRIGTIESAVARALDAAPAGERGVASFNPRSVAWFRLHRPGLTRVLTVRRLGPAGGPEWLRWFLGRALLGQQVAPDGISVGIKGVSARAVEQWHEQGGVTWTWTVQTPEQLARAQEAGATPIVELPVDPDPPR